MTKKTISDPSMIESIREIFVPIEHLQALANAAEFMKENYKEGRLSDLTYVVNSDETEIDPILALVVVRVFHRPEFENHIDKGLIPIMFLLAGELYVSQKISKVSKEVKEKENPLYAQVVNSYLNKILEEN